MGGEDFGEGSKIDLSILMDEYPPARSRVEGRSEIAAIQGGNNALLSHFLRDETTPKFTGLGGDFDEWQWRLQRHISTLEAAQGTTFPECLKKIILVKALSEHDRRWLDMLERQGERITFQTIMAKLRARAEPTKESQARQKWEALFFRTNGKIMVQELYHFEVDFREAQAGVPEITEEERYRHLLSKLPQHLSG